MSRSGNPAGRPSTPVLGRTAWARSLETPLREFLRTETGGAAVLLATAVAALVWVNADASSYESLWGTTMSIDLGGAGVALDLRHWVNSGLMTFFFFVVGLEARREFDLGELRERRRFALPLLAAVGGMAVAIAIYLAFNAGRSSAGGWAGEVMKAQLEATGREAVLVEDAASIRMMGFPILEALPSRGVRYEQVDPFILVHEGRIRLSDMKGVDTRHPHRGFDNLWYILEGSVSTGHSTGPGGAMERARLTEGALLALRTGRGAWHAEAIGADELEEGQADTEFRGVLFWVNLARKDKQAEPSAQVVQPEQIPVRQEGDATVRVLVGEGSPVRLGTPAIVLDVELPRGGEVTTTVPPEFQGFAYVLEGEASFGANRRRARPPQLVLLGTGEAFPVTHASPGTRYLLMAGEPYGEVPVFNGPFVD